MAGEKPRGAAAFGRTFAEVEESRRWLVRQTKAELVALLLGDSEHQFGDVTAERRKIAALEERLELAGGRVGGLLRNEENLRRELDVMSMRVLAWSAAHRQLAEILRDAPGVVGGRQDVGV